MFSSVLARDGISAPPSVVALDVSKLRTAAPDLLVCDLDGLAADPFELLRRIRFVLPECVIAVYTNDVEREWSLSCHLAGANCVLSKIRKPKLTKGLRHVMRSGCYTSPSQAE